MTLFIFQGKLMYISDMVSRAPVDNTTENDAGLQEEADSMMEAYIAHLPVNKQHLDEAHTPRLITTVVINGLTRATTIPYRDVQGELTVHDNLLLYVSHNGVPKSLQKEKIHEGD